MRRIRRRVQGNPDLGLHQQVAAGHGLVSESDNLGQRLDDESDSLVMTSVTQLHNRTSVSVTN